MRKSKAAILLILLSSSAGLAGHPAQGEIAEAARSFLASQGYTAAPIVLVETEVKFELWDREMSFESLVNQRYGTIKPCALEVLAWEGGWLVSFPLTEKGKSQEPFRPDGAGRHVFVSANLEHMSVIGTWAPLPNGTECL